MAICNSMYEEREEKAMKLKKLFSAVKSESLDDRIRRVREAFYETMRDPMPKPVDSDASDVWVEDVGEDWIVVADGSEYFRYPYTENDGGEIVFGQPEAVERGGWQAKHVSNALKTVSRTDDELRVANYIVLFGGRDLEGVASPQKNPDGTVGEYFAPDTELESRFTKTGRLPVDWEHRQAPEGEDPGTLGWVDWSTAKRMDAGVWVERVLDRRNEYIKYLEELIDAGLIGNSSEAEPTQVQKAEDGKIECWPLMGDTLTVTPMEPRMLSQNVLQAAKALGLIAEQPEPEAEAETEAEGREVAEVAEAGKATEDEEDASAAAERERAAIKARKLKTLLTLED